MSKTSNRIVTCIVNLVAVIALIFGINAFATQGGSGGIISLVWTCCVFILMAASLNISMGIMGQLSLGQCGFMAVGAYTATFVANQLKAAGFYESARSSNYIFVLLIGLVVGGVAAAIVGLILGGPALRLDGDYLAIITLGFGLIIISILNNIAKPVLYSEDCGLYILDRIKSHYLWMIMAITAVCVALMFTFIRSKYGRALKSIREDSIASSASGININYYKILGFTFSAFFAGIAGVLYAAMMSSLATANFNFVNSNIYNSIFIVVMVVLGGMNSFTGSVVTAAAMVVINQGISSIPQSSFIHPIAKYPMLLYAIILILFILFRPKGIFGSTEFSLMGIFRAIGKLFKKGGKAHE